MKSTLFNRNFYVVY